MKKILYFVVFIMISLSILGCSTNKADNEPNPIPHEEEKLVTLYYANKEYIKTGNEKLEKLIPVERSIANDDNLYLNILNELKKSPEEGNAYSELPAPITFLGVRVENKIAYVDISSEKLNGGSLQEFFVINQIVYTLTELEEIDKVQFLVDGKKVESLMGHYMADEPLSREK